MQFVVLVLASIMSFVPSRSVLRYKLEPGYRHSPRRFAGLYQSDYFCGGNHSHVLDGTTLYSSGWSSNGWLALNVSDPFNIRKIGWVEDSAHIDRATHLSLDGRGYGYCVSERGDSLTVIDTSIPQSMVAVGHYVNHSLMNLPVASVCDGGNWCWVIARGEYEDTPFTTSRTTGDALLAFDITNPETPILRSYVQDHTYLRGPRSIVWLEDTEEVVCSCMFGRSITAYDISNTATSMPRAWTIDLSSISMEPHSICAIPGTDYAVAVGGSILAVVRIKTTPGITGAISDSTNMSNAYGVAVKGDYAFVACRYGNGVSVYDISDYANPAYVTKLTDSDYLGGAYYITADPTRDYVYVSAYTGNALVILDVSDPTDISIAGPSTFRPLSVINDQLRTTREAVPKNRIQSMSKGGPSSHVKARAQSAGSEETEFRPIEQWELLQVAMQSTAVDDSISLSGATIGTSTIYHASGDFVNQGIHADQWIQLSGSSVYSGNKYPARVTAVTADTITCDATFTGQIIDLTINQNRIESGMFGGLSFELERHYQDADEYIWFPGQAVSRWDFAWGQRSGAMQSTFKIMGAAGEPSDTSQGLSYETLSTEVPMGSKHATALTFNGSSILESIYGFRLWVENPIEFTWEKTGPNPEAIRRTGPMAVGGTIQVYYTDYDAVVDALDGSAGELLMTADNGSLFCLDLPSITPKLSEGPDGSGRGDHLFYGWEFLADCSGAYLIGMDLFESV